MALDAVKAQDWGLSTFRVTALVSTKNIDGLNMKLILASTSPYRIALLRRLRIPFETLDPAVDERLIEGENPSDRANRLAALKADSVTTPGVLAIGSDQVACVDGNILRKPLTPDAAVHQLLLCSGRTIRFWTAISLKNTTSLGRSERLVSCDVTLRDLLPEEAERYVQLDEPMACAGSFKWEALGISLFRSIHTDDPTALEGLPLIAVCDLLREAGVPLPLLSEKI